MKAPYHFNFFILFFSIISLYGQIDPQDKNVLITLYNSTNGSNWYNSWNLSSDGSDWHGVSLNELGKVTELRLDFNNLDGTLPLDLENLDQLVTLSVTENNLKGKLPNFSNAINLERLWISENNFKFEDFEDQFVHLNNTFNFSYQPQKSICPSLTTRLKIGERKRLFAGSNSPSNTYRWTKDGIDIPDATSHEYLIDSMTSNDEGIYECFITNSIITNLELTRGENKITLSKNLLKNANFEEWFEIFNETNIANWFVGVSENKTYVTQTDEAISGKYAIKVQTNRINANEGNFGRLVVESTSNRFTLEEDKTYIISYDYKVINGNINNITTKLINENLVEHTEIHTEVKQNKWNNYTYTFNGVKTSEFYDFEILFESSSADSEVILDNLSIIEESNIKPNITSLDEFYIFTENSETYTPLDEAEADNVIIPENLTSYFNTIPFDFTYAGQTTNFYRFSQSPEMIFTGSTGGKVTNDLAKIDKDLITPLKDETLIGFDTRIISKTIGTSPNRIHILEFKNAYWSDDNTKGKVNIQIHLEETTNNISFVYGSKSPDPNSTRTTSIGFAANFTEETSAFLSLTPSMPSTISTTEVNQNISRNQFPPEGTIYNFTYIGEEQCQAPSEISISETSSASEMIVSWQKPLFSDKNTLFVKEFDSEEITSFITSKSSYILKDLKPETLYETWVVNNCSEEQSSIPSLKKIFVTPNSQPCRSPLITSLDTNKNRISITLNPLGQETEWGFGIKEESENINQIDETDLTFTDTPSFSFENLKEDTSYTVFHVAKCGENQLSSLSNRRTFWTSSDCPRPRDLTSIYTSESTAEISWKAIGTETSWEVVIQEESLGEPSEQGILTNTPNYQVTNLNNTTITAYYVRAVCSDTEKSEWSKKVITEELQSERDLLIAFYNATDGPNWINSKNWNTENPLSSWHGVGMENGRVIGLNLWNNGLSGNLPDEVFNLVKLNVLYLNSNNLTGTLSPNISKLKELKELDLTFNFFEENIPSEIGELTNLKALNLLNNQFEGELPKSIGNLKNLERAYLQSINAITVPNTFSDLTNLRSLRISDSNLSTFPQFILSLPKLSSLDLRSNNFQGEFPIETLSSSLSLINLNSNNFSGSILNTISTNRDLQYLDIRNNNFEGNISADIEKWSNLIRLDIAGNNFHGKIPPEILNINTLDSFHIDTNNFDFKNLEDFLTLNPSIFDFTFTDQSLKEEEIELNKLTGDKVVLTTTVAGDNNTYQWYKNELTPIEGAISSTLELNNITLEDTGNYHCIVSNDLISDFTLQKELYTLTINILDEDNDGVDDHLDQCLDTPKGIVVTEDGCPLFTLPANNFTVEITGESCRNSDNGAIKVSSKNTSYTMTGKLEKNGILIGETNFTNIGIIESIPSGSYELFITIGEEPSFLQRFSVQIEEPKPLNVSPNFDLSSKTATLELSGATNYLIEINGLKFSTSETEVQLPLDQNKNEISVSTEKECQGVFKKIIYLSEEISIFPNPFTDNITVSMGQQEALDSTIKIYDISGSKIYEYTYLINNNDITIDTSNFLIGVYIVDITTNNTQRIFKIVKR